MLRSRQKPRRPAHARPGRGLDLGGLPARDPGRESSRRPPRSAYGRAINMSVHVGDKNLGGLPAQSPDRGACRLPLYFFQTRVYLIVRRPISAYELLISRRNTENQKIRVNPCNPCPPKGCQPAYRALACRLFWGQNIGPRFAKGRVTNES